MLNPNANIKTNTTIKKLMLTNIKTNANIKC